MLFQYYLRIFSSHSHIYVKNRGGFLSVTNERQNGWTDQDQIFVASHMTPRKVYGQSEIKLLIQNTFFSFSEIQIRKYAESIFFIYCLRNPPAKAEKFAVRMYWRMYWDWRLPSWQQSNSYVAFLQSSLILGILQTNKMCPHALFQLFSEVNKI